MESLDKMTDPLEQSQWSAGHGECFIYFDFAHLDDGKVIVHSAYDFGRCKNAVFSNTTSDFEFEIVSKEDVPNIAADMLARAQSWFTEIAGHPPTPIKHLRDFHKALKQSVKEN